MQTLFIFLPCNVKLQWLNLQFLCKWDNSYLFSLLSVCFLWIRGNFNASGNRWAHPTPEHHSQTLKWQIAPLTLNLPFSFSAVCTENQSNWRLQLMPPCEEHILARTVGCDVENRVRRWTLEGETRNGNSKLLQRSRLCIKLYVQKLHPDIHPSQQG